MNSGRFDYPDLPFVSALTTSAIHAQRAGLRMTLLLKNGERIEGVPTNAEGAFEPPFDGVYVDRTPDETPENWPYTWTITIGDRTILAQEVAEFSVAHARAA